MSAPESRWRHLLDIALPALRHVFGAEDPSAPPLWTLGGGTALALWLDHRTSFDIDLFVPSVPLRSFTPSVNPAAAAISSNFQWPGHYLKFETPDGEIDFLSPHIQTVPGYAWAEVFGRDLPIETPEEIIVKKLRYRSANLTPRDIFDIASTAEARSGLVDVIAEYVSDALPRSIESLEFVSNKNLDLSRYVYATEKSKHLLSSAFDIAGDVLAQAASKSRSKPNCR